MPKATHAHQQIGRKPRLYEIMAFCCEIMYVQRSIWKIFTEIVILSDRISIAFYLCLQIFWNFWITSNLNITMFLFSLWKKIELAYITVVFSDPTKTAKSLFGHSFLNAHSVLVTMLTNNYFTCSNDFTQTLSQVGISMCVDLSNDL